MIIIPKNKDEKKLSLIQLGHKPGTPGRGPLGWVSCEFVSETRVEDEGLPFHRGSMIQIVTSPSPDKVPDGSMAMFIDYNRATYRIRDMIEVEAEDDFERLFGLDGKEEREQVQYNMKVLYNEKVIELFNAKLEEMGSNYIGVSSPDRAEKNGNETR